MITRPRSFTCSFGDRVFRCVLSPTEERRWKGKRCDQKWILSLDDGTSVSVYSPARSSWLRLLEACHFYVGDLEIDLGGDPECDPSRVHTLTNLRQALWSEVVVLRSSRE